MVNAGVVWPVAKSRPALSRHSPTLKLFPFPILYPPRLYYPSPSLDWWQRDDKYAGEDRLHDPFDGLQLPLRIIRKKGGKKKIGCLSGYFQTLKLKSERNRVSCTLQTKS